MRRKRFANGPGGSLLAVASALILGGLLVGVPLVAPRAAPASADGEIAVAIADPDDSAFPDLTLVMTADRGGRPLTQLGVANVSVTEGGEPAVVTSVRRAQDSGIPLALVVTVDTSGSMQGPSVDAAKAAAGALIQKLSTADSVAMVAFSDQVRVVEPPTRDRAALQRAIAGLLPTGNTALYDAVGESARLAAESGGLRRAVILLSDGREFGGSSRLTRDQALERATRGGAVFYTVGIGPDIDRAFLDEVAARSGGRSFEASGANEVPQIYAALEELLRGQFVVTARSSAPAGGAARQIRVEIREGGGQGVLQRQYISRRSDGGPVPAPSGVTQEVKAPPVAAVPEAQAGAGALSLPLMGLTALLVIGAAAFGLRQLSAARGGRARPRVPGPFRLARRGSVDLPPSSGLLRVLAGTPQGAWFEIESAPATIGSAADCLVQVSGDGIAPHHARLWWRDGKPMLHHIGGSFETRVNGVPINWASLEVGAEIQLGSTMLRFEAMPNDVEAAEDEELTEGRPPVSLRQGA